MQINDPTVKVVGKQFNNYVTDAKMSQRECKENALFNQLLLSPLFQTAPVLQMGGSAQPKAPQMRLQMSSEVASSSKDFHSSVKASGEKDREVNLNLKVQRSNESAQTLAESGCLRLNEDSFIMTSPSDYFCSAAFSVNLKELTLEPSMPGSHQAEHSTNKVRLTCGDNVPWYHMEDNAMIVDPRYYDFNEELPLEHFGWPLDCPEGLDDIFKKEDEGLSSQSNKLDTDEEENST